MTKEQAKQKTKGDVWRAYVRRGYDYCYAQFLADEWEKRQQKKTTRAASEGTEGERE